MDLRTGLARPSGGCTRVLILTNEGELGRLVRRTLSPAYNVTAAATVPMKLEGDAEAFDVVIVDLEPFDLTKSPASGVRIQTPRLLRYAVNIAKPTASRFCKEAPTT